MPISPEGYWYPNLGPKQLEIYNSYKRYLLVSGPKKSGKTLGVAHKVIRHAVDTDRARVGIFSKTIKVAKDGGCWSDVVDTVLPEWFAADVGIKYKTPPKLDAATRQSFFEITNRAGTSSRVVLNSLDYDDDIESAIKGKRYSMIWFNELSNFQIRKVFDISIDQLRCVHLPFDSHQWIGDTNPADEGEQSWIYKLWYMERLLEEFPTGVDSEEDKNRFREFQKHLGLIEIMIPENPFLDEQTRSALYSTFRHDKDLYNRYCLGAWTSSTTDSHFSDVFRPELHIVGSVESPNQSDWEVLIPEESCDTLITGWDMGSVNHSLHIIEPALLNGVTVFKVMDEILLLQKNISIADLTEGMMEKMDYWEKQVGRPVKWHHWSDRNAFDAFRPAAELYDYNIVYQASHGRIMLAAAPKFHQSIKARVNLTRRLLFQDRIMVSASCPGTIQMFKSLKKGTSAIDFIDRRSIHKHSFDSLSYPISAELPLEMDHGGPRTKGKLVMAGF